MKDNVRKFLRYVGGIKQHCLPKISVKNPLNTAKTNRNKAVIDQCNDSS
jgi:hypothetical protein